MPIPTLPDASTMNAVDVAVGVEVATANNGLLAATSVLPSIDKDAQGVVEPKPRRPFNEVSVEVAMPSPKLMSPPDKSMSPETNKLLFAKTEIVVVGASNPPAFMSQDVPAPPNADTEDQVNVPTLFVVSTWSFVPSALGQV